MQYVDFGLPLQQAIEAPRARLWDGHVRAGRGARRARRACRAASSAATTLRAFADWTMKVGGMQAVAVDPATGVMTGGCDPRRDGYAVAV